MESFGRQDEKRNRVAPPRPRSLAKHSRAGRLTETSTGRPIASVLGKNLWEAYPAITLTPDQVAEVLRSKKTVTIKHSQRDQYYFDITIYALTDKGETGVVILVDDITKQMKAENKVAERDKISSMGELASAMAYDINFTLGYSSITFSNGIFSYV